MAGKNVFYAQSCGVTAVINASACGVIEAARKAGVKAPISIDTFRASVARAAVAAGADMINDVSGGLLDDEMLRTAADLGVPICLMHYRGDPSTMVCRLSLPSRPNP